jgi:hypothetical protein
MKGRLYNHHGPIFLKSVETPDEVEIWGFLPSFFLVVYRMRFPGHL